MKNTLALLTCITAFLLTNLTITTQAQTSKWELNIDSEIRNPILSPNGKYLVYGHKDHKSAECVDVQTGKIIWSNKLTDFKKYEIFRFVNDDVVLLGQANRYEFTNVKDGSVIKSLNIFGKDDWGDLKWDSKPPEEEGYETIKPYHRSNIGIYYFDDGMQVIDLEKQEILMETKDRPSKLQYKEWGNVMMILPRGGADSIYFIDFEKRKLIYRAALDDHDINTSLYQPFAMNDKELILFNDDNIESVDLATEKVTATMKIDTDDPDFFFVSDLAAGLHLLVSEDDVQKFYRTSDGALLWETPKKAVPGIVDQIIEVKDNKGLLLTYKDREATVYKVDLKTGEIAWSREVFKQRGDLETGHKEGSKFAAALKTFAVSMLVSMISGPANRSGMRYDRSTGLYSYYRDPFGRSRERDRRRLINGAYSSFLSRKKTTDAYMDMLTQNDNEVTLVVAGRAYDPEDSKWKAADHEGVYAINLETGEIANSSKATILADKGGSLNAYTDLKIVQLPVASASALVGVNDLYIQRDGKIEHIPFGKQKVTFLGSSDSTVVFTTTEKEEQFDYWVLDATFNPSRLVLLARSDEPNIVFPPDTAVFAHTIQFQDYTITSHELSISKPGEEPPIGTPEWTLTEDDLDKMEIGRLTKNIGYADSTQGIYSTAAGVFLMGDDRIALISEGGTCKWSYEWDPNRAKVRIAPKLLKGHIVFAMGGREMIVKNDCSGTVVATHEISYGDCNVMTSPEGAVIVVNVDDGLIYGYWLN